MRVFLFPILLLGFLFMASLGYGRSDTLFICQGESIQLQTTPNQLSYQWNPASEFTDPTIYNPIISPTETKTYYVRVETVQDVNLVANGDFSAGNTGFTTDYQHTTTSTYDQGHYAIFTNPQDLNPGFGNCRDHTPSADGLMFVADGATIPNERVWCQNIAVDPGRTYDFSAWICNVHPTAPSRLQFSINNNLLGDVVEVQQPVCEWEEFVAEWYSSGFSGAQICITNQSTIAFGNDFAIDDISFMLNEPSYIDTFTVVVLETSNTQIDTTLCANERFIYQGESIAAGTQQDYNFVGANGCDSIVSISVNAIDTSLTQTLLDTFCLGDTVFLRGLAISQDTAICEIFTNVLGCDSSICFIALFFSEAPLQVNFASPSCAGLNDGSLMAQPNAGKPPYQYAWSNGVNQASVEQLVAGTYGLTVTDARGCRVEEVVTLNEPEPIVPEFTFQEPSCFGDQDGQIEIAVSGGTPDYQFFFEGDATVSDTLISELSAGTYGLSIEDALGCRLDTLISLGQPNSLQIVLPADTSIALGCDWQIDAQISSELPYELQWRPVVGLDCGQCERPQLTALQELTYFLEVIDANGCRAVDSLQLSLIRDYAVYFPNVFSPNGDGVNDFFEVYAGKAVEQIASLKVFNRWGALVFQQEDYAPGDAIGRWDGSFRGDFYDPGVFVFVAEILFLDGAVEIFSGDITILD